MRWKIKNDTYIATSSLLLCTTHQQSILSVILITIKLCKILLITIEAMLLFFFLVSTLNFQTLILNETLSFREHKVKNIESNFVLQLQYTQTYNSLSSLHLVQLFNSFGFDHYLICLVLWIHNWYKVYSGFS